MSDRPVIDLRSDTVTKPTLAMRQAMFDAEVGDDVYGEDPTVNRLEARAAEIVGKEAAVFIPTGTMGNTIGIKLLTEHGQEVISDSRAHLVDWELSMTPWFSGCHVRTVETSDGILTWDKIRGLIKPVTFNSAPTGAISLENTHNMGGGRFYTQGAIDEICDGAHELGVRVHMDARVFNAAAGSGRTVKQMAAKVDTLTFCLSKALGAPMGSILAGSKSLMDRARLYRKRLGGGTRQAGIVAAAGLIALEQGPAGLPNDHANATFIAAELAKIPALKVTPAVTNIVIVDVSATGLAPKEISARLRERGVRMNGFNDRMMRALTHRDVTREQCEVAVAEFAAVVGEGGTGGLNRGLPVLHPMDTEGNLPVEIIIRTLTASEARALIPDLSSILIDCVHAGASVSFMAPLSREKADAFWRGVAESVAAGDRILFAAEETGADILIGTVQLILHQPENQPHRADVSKMLVHPKARKRGIGTALMRAVENNARQTGKTLLVLDTATGGDAERLYGGLGWIKTGIIPHYALWPDGRPCDTTIYYKQLAQ